MRTSLNEIRQIEDYLSGSPDRAERLVFEAKLLTDPVLREKVALQKQVYMLIRAYSRKQLKSELGRIHRRLFRDPEKASFRESVFQLFRKT